MALRVLLGDREILPPYLIRKSGFSEQEHFEIADEHLSCELIYGELIMHSSESITLESLFGFLLVLLNIFCEKKRLGTILGSRYAMRLEKDLIFEPDIIFVVKDNAKNLKDTYLEGACDLAVEILSKTTRSYDLNEKRQAYTKHSIPEIWFIDLDEKALIVDLISGSSYGTKSLQKGVFESTVLEGFSIQVGWLWEDPLPLMMDCIENDFTS